MKKIIQIEYVGIEDVQEILDDARAVMSVGHYVNVSIANVGALPLVSVNIILDGFVSSASYDYSYSFYMSDEESEVALMNSCKSTLKNLLVED